MRRLHGPTKAATLGIGALLIASMIYFLIAQGHLSLHELLITIFLFLTAPVTALMISKAHILRDHNRRRELPPTGRPVGWATLDHRTEAAASDLTTTSTTCMMQIVLTRDLMLDGDQHATAALPYTRGHAKHVRSGQKSGPADAAADRYGARRRPANARAQYGRRAGHRRGPPAGRHFYRPRRGEPRSGGRKIRRRNGAGRGHDPRSRMSDPGTFGDRRVAADAGCALPSSADRAGRQSSSALSRAAISAVSNKTGSTRKPGCGSGSAESASVSLALAKTPAQRSETGPAGPSAGTTKPESGSTHAR